MGESNLGPGRLDSKVVMQWAVVFAVVVALLSAGRSFLVPLAVALLISNLLGAITNGIAKLPGVGHVVPKWVARLLSIVLLIGFFWVVYRILAGQSDGMIAAAPVYQERFAALIANVSGSLGLTNVPTTGQLFEQVNIGAILRFLGGSLGSLVSNTVLVAIYVGFLLAEQTHTDAKFDRLDKEGHTGGRARELLRAISTQVQTYIWLKTLTSSLTGIVSYAILRIIGVDFAEIWALLIFLLNFIPNIGSIVAVTLPAILALVQFDTLNPFAAVVVFLGATQFLIGSVIEPQVMGRTLNVSSLVIILALTFWGTLWGVAGMFLSVPITVMLAIVCAHFTNLRWIAVLLSSDGRIPEPAALSNQRT